MAENICLVLLILCGIWSQGIIGSFAEENITESSRFLVRGKRVVNSERGGDRPVPIEEHPYIAIIKLSNRIFCVGTILSHYVVLTAADCGRYERSHYKVVTGSSRTNRALTSHNVTRIIVNRGHHPDRSEDGIALFSVTPGIVYTQKAYKIDLHVGPVLPGMIGTVSGWGVNYRNPEGPGTIFPTELRSIEVPIIPHQQCLNIYEHFFGISERDICTFHLNRHCGHNDAGAPLVVDDLLVGIFLRRGPIQNPFRFGFPDVYAFLQDTIYSGWILANI